jgi:hypothetical protein
MPFDKSIKFPLSSNSISISFSFKDGDCLTTAAKDGGCPATAAKDVGELVMVVLVRDHVVRELINGDFSWEHLWESSSRESWSTAHVPAL